MAGKKKATKAKSLPDELKASAHRIWLAGLGALATAEEGGERLFRNLVERGERFETRGRKTVDKVAGRAKTSARKAADRAGDAWEKIGGGIDDQLTSALHRVGVPTRREIDELTSRVERLTVAVERMAGVPAKRTVKKKATKKKATRKTTTRRRATPRA